MEGLPELPECATHVWDWFYQLSGKRQCGMSVNPISWEAIESWSRHTGIKPKQWELDAIGNIDVAYLNSTAPEETT